MTLGQRVRSRRDALKLTQEDIAAELGVTHQHVSRIETGKAVPSLELLPRLAQVLGTSVDFLVNDENRTAADAVAAIRAEPDLSASAKKHLIGLLRELRRAPSG